MPHLNCCSFKILSRCLATSFRSSCTSFRVGELVRFGKSFEVGIESCKVTRSPNEVGGFAGEARTSGEVGGFVGATRTSGEVGGFVGETRTSGEVGKFLGESRPPSEVGRFLGETRTSGEVGDIPTKVGESSSGKLVSKQVDSLVSSKFG